MMWIDFEDVCLGPPEWDLATMMDEEAVAKYHDPDAEMLARCTELRTLQVALALIVFRDDFGDMRAGTKSSGACWECSPLRLDLETVPTTKRGVPRCCLSTKTP